MRSNAIFSEASDEPIHEKGKFTVKCALRAMLENYSPSPELATIYE